MSLPLLCYFLHSSIIKHGIGPLTPLHPQDDSEILAYFRQFVSWVQSNVEDGTVYLEHAQFDAYLPELTKPEFDDLIGIISPWSAEDFSLVCRHFSLEDNLPFTLMYFICDAV